MWKVRLSLFLAVPFLVCAEKWTEYRSGPFHVISDAGDKHARERLNELEQFRHAFGSVLGKQDLKTVWPVYLVVFRNQREMGGYVGNAPFHEGGSALLSAWIAETPLPPDWRRALGRLLLDANTRRMPTAVEDALLDLFSTLQVNATRISVGSPPPQKSRDWARLAMLATSEEFAGRLRVFFSNLDNGADEDTAIRNAFEKPAAEIWKLADAYLAAGKFEPGPISGRALNAAKDFIEVQIDAAPLLAELKSRTPASDSPRGLLAKGTREALLEAAKLNPNWAEPHFKLAALDSGTRKIEALKKAAQLEPRNAQYWRALAEAQTAANLFADAQKSWAGAERAAASDAERAAIRKVQLDLAEQRAEFELAEKRRIAAEQAAELQRIKDAAAAEVRAAEEAANKRLGSRGPAPDPSKVQQWWEDPKTDTKVSGTLIRVDCLAGPARLVIQAAPGKSTQVLVRDAKQIVVRSPNGADSFGCGAQRPARKVVVHYNKRLDTKYGTAGDAALIEFP
jgi:hypothetical protein